MRERDKEKEKPGAERGGCNFCSSMVGCTHTPNFAGANDSANRFTAVDDRGRGASGCAVQQTYFFLSRTKYRVNLFSAFTLSVASLLHKFKSAALELSRSWCVCVCGRE